MIASTQSQMPMGIAAQQRSTPPPLPQLSLPPNGASPSLPMPPSAVNPAPMGAPPMAAAPAITTPMGPPKPPWTVELQDDGSSIYQYPPLYPGGKPVTIGVNKPPKLSPAMQPKPATAAQ